MTKINIDTLTEYESNPRQIADDEFHRLCENLLAYGFLDPLVVDQNDTVIGGNQRLRAAKHLVSQGNESFRNVPVYRVDIADDTERAKVSMLLNNHSGAWDIDALAVLMDDLSIDVGELPDLGFDSLILDDLKIELDSPPYEPKDNEKEIDENIKTDNQCPKCGYKWS